MDDIAQDYERTEITTILLYHRLEKQYMNLFSVAEMCPPEQAPSPPITSVDAQGNLFNQAREAINRNLTIFVMRRFCNTPSVALTFFRGQDGHHTMTDIDGAKVDVQDASPPVLEPPNDVPLVLPQSTDSGMAMVLPRRLTPLRVCARLDARGAARKLLDDDAFDKVTGLTRQHLGIDLARFSEYLGATLLSFANPILRQMTLRLSKDYPHLVLTLYPRRSRSLEGLSVELTDERPTGRGFSVRYPCQTRQQIIPLPNVPYCLRTRLFHPQGDVLFDDATRVIQGTQINLGLIGPTRLLNMTHPDGRTETHKIETVRYDPPASVSSALTPEQILIAADRSRELDALETQRQFIYFPPDPSSKTKGKAIIRELLGQAREKCFICDPFLSARDVAEFALFVRNAAVEVRLIGSLWWLRQNVKDSVPKRTRAEELQKTIQSITRQDPTIQIACRVLKGKDKSPLHDRFLVIDDQVYILGSSLNEFGNRATTLFRVPNPHPLVAQAKEWWFQDTEAVGLDAWVHRRQKGEQ